MTTRRRTGDRHDPPPFHQPFTPSPAPVTAPHPASAHRAQSHASLRPVPAQDPAAAPPPGDPSRAITPSPGADQMTVPPPGMSPASGRAATTPLFPPLGPSGVLSQPPLPPHKPSQALPLRPRTLSSPSRSTTPVRTGSHHCSVTQAGPGPHRIAHPPTDPNRTTGTPSAASPKPGRAPPPPKPAADRRTTTPALRTRPIPPPQRTPPWTAAPTPRRHPPHGHGIPDSHRHRPSCKSTRCPSVRQNPPRPPT